MTEPEEKPKPNEIKAAPMVVDPMAVDPMAVDPSSGDTSALVVSMHDRPSRIVSSIWVPLGMCSVLASGIPAFLMLNAYNLMHINEILQLAVIPQKQLFLLFYLISLGPALPYLIYIFGLVFLRSVHDRVVPSIRIDAEGITVPLSCPQSCVLSSKRARSICKHPPVMVENMFVAIRSVIKWNDIAGIEYRLSADALRQPRIQLNLHCGEGRTHTCQIDLLKLSQEDRKKLSNALCKWAPEQAARRRRSQLQSWQQLNRSLLGAQESSHVSYTDIWLDHDGNRIKGVKLLFPGEILKGGRYRVIEGLAGGGQSNIYLVEDLENPSQSPLILKEFIVPISATLSSLLTEPFNVEKKILQQISHPGIVKLIDSFEGAGRACLILARAPGKTLASLVEEKGALSADETLKPAIKLARILKFLHRFEPGIIHRDFVPHNILIDRNMESASCDDAEADEIKNVTVIDFASALQISSDDEEEKDETVGTLAYTAPEQFKGKPRFQSDIYSLGATLYFALTGIEPEPLKRLSPRHENKNVPAYLDKIIVRCTEQSLKDRYKDIDELLADLLTCKD